MIYKRLFLIMMLALTISKNSIISGEIILEEKLGTAVFVKAIES